VLPMTSLLKCCVSIIIGRGANKGQPLRVPLRPREIELPKLIYVKCKSNNREVRQLAFLPQRPYLPLGTLRNALSYSSPSDAFPDADVGQALDRCDLGHLVAKLDKVERWDNELSLG
jgi:hypothetical protein